MNNLEEKSNMQEIKNKLEAIEAVQENGLALKYCALEMRKDFDVKWNAVNQNPFSIIYARYEGPNDTYTEKDRELDQLATKKCSRAARYTYRHAGWWHRDSLDILIQSVSDFEIIQNLLATGKSKKDILHYVLKNNEQIVFEMLLNYPGLFCFLSGFGHSSYARKILCDKSLILRYIEEYEKDIDDTDGFYLAVLKFLPIEIFVLQPRAN